MYFDDKSVPGDLNLRNKLLLDKAGPNGIAMLAGMKGNLLPRLGITTHEYYLSDRLSEARTQSVAGRNKIEYYLSDRLSEAHSLHLA